MNFTVGQRVKTTVAFATLPIGSVGTVKSLIPALTSYYVTFDNVGDRQVFEDQIEAA